MMQLMDDRSSGPDTEDERTQSPPPESPGLSKDDTFHILQNPRRRAVLRYLLDRDQSRQCQMRDVAEAVAAWENDTTTRQLTSDERQRVYIALYQSHLPKLDSYGVIRYDQARGHVEPNPLIGVFEPFLDAGLQSDTQRFSIDGAGGDGGGGSGGTDSGKGRPESPDADTGQHRFVDTLSRFLNR